MTIVEAMSLGVPVVGGKGSGGVPWQLGNGDCGILVDVESPASIASGIVGLVSDQPLYDTLRQRSVLRAEAHAFHQDQVAKVPELYQPQTLERIRGGAEVGTVAYVNARRRLDQLRRSIPRTFENVDLVITPTTPVPPFTISELLAKPDQLRAREIITLRNTRPFNALGLPTISVPCGFTSGGLPIGMQIAGRPGDEATVLRLADAYERATDWHNRRPAVG
jgi:Asp-tRNA(Asn)/Glu-tRNA(Gln) amidotransferase A subunit family amidase